MRKSDKKVSSKYLVLGIIFIVTMVLTFLSMSFESVTPSATTMSAATIPVITMQSEEGNEFNSLHGFTQEINQALINDNLTQWQRQDSFLLLFTIMELRCRSLHIR